MNRKLLFLTTGVLIILVSSCVSQKNIVYFQDIDGKVMRDIEKSYVTTIKKDDLLSIVVSASDKTVVQPFNLTLSENAYGGSSQDPSKSVLPYLVDSDGNIEFPVLGEIHVEGMSRSELVQYLTDEISKHVKEPVVSVSFENFKITVLGEVKAPGTYTMSSDKISVLQALGMAGDLLITAKRDGILLIREVDGVMTHYPIDLRSSDIMNSPYFFMQQNDVLYIPPSKSRIIQGTTNTSMWSVLLSSVTTIISVITLILTNVKL
ncbi:MAG: polysaccharide biosynthesis/export family protein [Bacteroidales bacterium]|nr:polysaccharide biosynthesis/export family protein [Bacteroidales bacterium]